MIYCKELNESFGTLKEMHKSLVHRREDIYQVKRSAVKFSDPFGLQIKSDEAVKSMVPDSEIKFGDYVYPVINTTNYLDSHSDVHIPGIWDKSIAEQQGKIYLIVDHQLEIGKVISWPKDVTPQLYNLPWTDLGKDYSGNTQALIFKSKLSERSNKDAFDAYKEGDPVQHSIRMQYVKLRMAINDKEYKEEFEAWENYYPMIANKEVADELGYFFAIIEAKIFKEGSMVLAGSNDATPTLYNLEPEKSTQDKQEPSDDTLKYLIENFKLN